MRCILLAALALGCAWLGAAPGAVAVTITTGDFTLAQDFVDLAFQDLLGRPPDPPVAALYESYLALENGDTEIIATELDTSPEYYGDLVRGYFQEFLGRPPTSGELGTYIPALQGGLTDQQLIAALISSSEYLSTHAITTNAGLVEQFFSVLLNRPPTPSEIIAWVGSLGGGLTADAFALDLLRSAEYQDANVTALFTQFLGFPPLPAEVTEIADFGLSDEGVISALVGSEVFLCLADPGDALCGEPPDRTVLIHVFDQDVPEPATLSLLGAGLAALAIRRRRRALPLPSAAKAPILEGPGNRIWR